MVVLAFYCKKVKKSAWLTNTLVAQISWRATGGRPCRWTQDWLASSQLSTSPTHTQFHTLHFIHPLFPFTTNTGDCCSTALYRTLQLHTRIITLSSHCKSHQLSSQAIRIHRHHTLAPSYLINTTLLYILIAIPCYSHCHPPANLCM